jgi:hypothetical protein
MEDELVKQTHDSLRMGGRTFPTPVKSTLTISYMLGTCEPVVDSIPDESVLRRVARERDVPAMREINLSSHTILTLSLGELYFVSSESGGVDVSYHVPREYCFLDRHIGRHPELGPIRQRYASLDLRPTSGIPEETHIQVRHPFCIFSETFIGGIY